MLGIAALTECDAMLAAARESGRLLSVVAQNRFRDDIATLKEVVDSGLVGSPHAVEPERRGPRR